MGNLNKGDKQLLNALHGTDHPQEKVDHKKYRCTFKSEMIAKMAWGDILWDKEVSHRHQISPKIFEIGTTPENIAEYAKDYPNMEIETI